MNTLTPCDTITLMLARGLLHCSCAELPEKAMACL